MTQNPTRTSTGTVPRPSATHCAQLPAPPDSPGFLSQSIFPPTKGSSRWARCDKGPPLHLTKVPRDVTPPGAAPGWRRHMGSYVGFHQWSQTHGCLQGMLKSRSVGQGFAPHPTEGHHSQGCSLPLQPVSIRPCCGKSLKALAELCRGVSQMDGARHTPGRRGSARPQTRDGSFTPPAPLRALGSHPALTSRCSGAWTDPSLGKLGPPPHPRAPQHTSRGPKMWVTPEGTQSPKMQIEAQA